MSSAPFSHRLIEASAGSGKTYQLTSRFLALLANAVEPSELLATTFTRKAAGEILDRVFHRLAVAAGDASESAKLAMQINTERLTADRCTGLLRELVRNLHRLRVSTLDSFYIGLAGAFSLDVGLPAAWGICEELDDAALRRDALERLLDQHPEDLLQLNALLSKGETNRSVQRQLLDIIAKHYDVFRSSTEESWSRLPTIPPIAAAELAETAEQLRSFDMAMCGHKGFAKTRDKDLVLLAAEDWKGLLESGFISKLNDGQTTYYGKPIPAELQALYRSLCQHVRAQLLQRLAAQTAATWDLLSRFHRELWRLKLATGMLRFGDVTQALVDGLLAGGLGGDVLAFRLDGHINHLLLDEFQDTSLEQWQVLRPMAEAITRKTSGPARSFFCVGDPKQAIYRWRGGMTAILHSLESTLGPLEKMPLSESHRSAQPIIDVVNQVFGSLGRVDLGSSCADGLEAWARRFQKHTTAKKDLSGFVCLHAGPEQQEDDSLDDHRQAHCRYVAERMAELFTTTPQVSIGVLCRTNAVVAWMMYELGQVKIRASEEGGNPLTDSPAVEVILSLLTLADHPQHSAAWFHLQHSPLRDKLPAEYGPDALSRNLRRDLVTSGYGRFTQAWAEQLAPACNQRDLARLQQLVDMAYGYQPRSTLRADDFVATVRQQRVADPAGVNVRVMTIHAAKGLQFDVVILPELEVSLRGDEPPFVVGRDAKDLSVNFVCRYADESIQKLLDSDQAAAFLEDRRQRVEESLSLLYVALTRAVHALHMFIPGPRNRKQTDACYNLLLQTLAPDRQCEARTCMYEHGDAGWQKTVARTAAPATSIEPEATRRITFKPAASRRRGLDHVGPSRREGQGQVSLEKLFDASERRGMAIGTLYHAWFAAIEWLDAGSPSLETLRQIAEKLGTDLPAERWRDREKLILGFSACLQRPEVSAVLCRSAYAHPDQPGFPRSLASFWSDALRPSQIERERRFIVADESDSKFWSGSMDRVVWLCNGDQIVAADVLDFKTDAVAAGDEPGLAVRVEFYRPQMEAYREAAARLERLPSESVAIRLVFTALGRVVDLSM
jgi:ATP-dependent exoDNAse (exonuclease V) beta subunit